MDAKTTHDYFLGPSSLGPIMQLLVLLCQYQFVIKKAKIWHLLTVLDPFL